MRHAVVEEEREGAGHLVGGDGADGHVRSREALHRLPPGARPGLVGEVVLQDAHGGHGDAVHHLAERAEDGVVHLGGGEDVDERAQDGLGREAVGRTAGQLQDAGGGRAQGEGPAQGPPVLRADGQADDVGGAVRGEALVEQLVGDEPVGLVDDQEAAVAGGLRGVQGGAHGGAGVAPAVAVRPQVEADGVAGQGPFGQDARAHSAPPPRLPKPVSPGPGSAK